MMTLQEISDRLEIQQNLWDYSNAVDLQDWDLYRRVFLPTATDFYDFNGRVLRSVDEAIAWLQEVMTSPPIIGFQHIMGNLWIDLRGDEAESFTHCFNPQQYVQPDGETVSLHLQFHYYHFRHVRTPEGWKIANGAEGPWVGPTALGRMPQHSTSRWAAPPVRIADRRLPGDQPASHTPRYGL
jgi:hypothetical protein